MKSKYRPPKKKGTLAQRIAAEKKLKEAIAEKEKSEASTRLRMAWAFVISMAETEGVELTPEQIGKVVDGMDANLDEYYRIKSEDGEEIADIKMYMRVCELLGQDPSECDYRPERIFDSETILKEAETVEAEAENNESV